MTTKKAFEFLENNGFLNSFYHAVEKRPDIACGQVFAIDGECFYITWDDCDGIKKGKHTAKRSAYLIRSGQALVVR